MNEGSRQPWVRVRAVALLGFSYALVGIVFALPATHVRAWRLTAWLVCAAGYAAHIGYERFLLKSPSRSGALHVALAVALGAFGLAVVANIHSLSSGPGTQHRQLLLLSLGIWPVITALPAFLLALGISAVLARAFSGADTREPNGVPPNPELELRGARTVKRPRGGWRGRGR